MNHDAYIENWEDFELGKIEDAGAVVKGGRIDQYWQSEGIENEVQDFFDDLPAHDWLFDSNKAKEHFNLRSIEFGNWMSQQDRANFLYASMLSLHHLAKIFKIKDEHIGFGGKLSIALGARGKGRAAGHYEPIPNSVINLTKTNPIGVLAHEYAHAIDNILSFHTKTKQTYVSGGRTERKGYDENIAKNGNWFEKQFEELFNILFFKSNGEKTDFHTHLITKEDYWNRRTEVFARTFEVYISEKMKTRKFKNTFFNHTSYEGDKNYPSSALTKKVSKLIDGIVMGGFKTMLGESTLYGISTVSGYDGFRKTLKQNGSLRDTLENMPTHCQARYLPSTGFGE